MGDTYSQSLANAHAKRFGSLMEFPGTGYNGQDNPYVPC